ncbi:hypothetical protein ElyMa_005809400 [Elysia marginata]|uniref:Uncharacterized protein n=1 Tax=Elysia marginata TaxID=1093978 RepID=A0AAV4FVH9_9GAST|nr:hypothetical protein ElyMa_005809400 [Elysia marginata]
MSGRRVRSLPPETARIQIDARRLYRSSPLVSMSPDIPEPKFNPYSWMAYEFESLEKYLVLSNGVFDGDNCDIRLIHPGRLLKTSCATFKAQIRLLTTVKEFSSKTFLSFFTKETQQSISFYPSCPSPRSEPIRFQQQSRTSESPKVSACSCSRRGLIQPRDLDLDISTQQTTRPDFCAAMSQGERTVPAPRNEDPDKGIPKREKTLWSDKLPRKHSQDGVKIQGEGEQPGIA